MKKRKTEKEKGEGGRGWGGGEGDGGGGGGAGGGDAKKETNVKHMLLPFPIITAGGVAVCRFNWREAPA